MEKKILCQELWHSGLNGCLGTPASTGVTEILSWLCALQEAAQDALPTGVPVTLLKGLNTVAALESQPNPSSATVGTCVWEVNQQILLLLPSFNKNKALQRKRQRLSVRKG